MSRLPLILALALATGVVVGSAGEADAKVTKKSSKKATKKKSSSKKSSAKSSKRSKRGSGRVTSRTAMQGRGSNMPNGFAWPPTAAMDTESKACEAELDRLKITWERASKEGHIPDPIHVRSMAFGGITYTSFRQGPFHMDCHLAKTLEEIGPTLHDLGVREVRFGSLYRWSRARANGRWKPFLSRHALGLAMDIVSFVDDNGRVAVVGKDYMRGDPLLHALEDAINGSGKFRTVLTPKNDPISHDDHFHIEAAVDYSSK